MSNFCSKAYHTVYLMGSLAPWVVPGLAPCPASEVNCDRGEKHHNSCFVMRGAWKGVEESGGPLQQKEAKTQHLHNSPALRASIQHALRDYIPSGVYKWTHDQMWNMARNAQWDIQFPEIAFNGCYCACSRALSQIVRNNAPQHNADCNAWYVETRLEFRFPKLHLCFQQIFGEKNENEVEKN